MIKQTLFILYLLVNAFCCHAQDTTIRSTVFAIFKCSYNLPVLFKLDNTMKVGIRGVGSLINDSTICMANHVAITNFFKPDSGYTNFQVWILSAGQKLAIEVDSSYLVQFPKVDIAFIHLKQKIHSRYLPLNSDTLKKGDSVMSIAFNSRTTPNITLLPGVKKFAIQNYNLDHCMITSKGVINNIIKTSVADLTAPLVLLSKLVYEVSFKTEKGYSGSPLISNNKNVGVLIFGYPQNAIIKDKSFAITSSEILRYCEML